MRNKPSVDLTGKRFGKWSVVEYAGNSKWMCVCDCGTTREVSTANLNSGNTHSCGCYKRETTIKNNTTHGMNKTPLHSRWLDIKDRCYNAHDKNYVNYGGRGIGVCDEWKDDFMAFHDWAVANGFRKELTIDRIDNNKDYSPQNCRWVDRATQNRNTRRNHYVTIDGETKTVMDWALTVGINESLIRARLKRGWSERDAVYKPPRPIKRAGECRL